MGIRQIITGQSEQGDVFTDPSWTSVERTLQKLYVNNKVEKERRENMLTRRRLYDCAGLSAALALIEEVFKDEDVKALRREVAPYARYNNVLRRIVNERARVYAKPAKKRAVLDTAGNANYQRIQKLTHHDLAMRMANQLLELQNDVFVSFRVRETPMGREPRTDVIGQEDFFAVHHPDDATLLIAVIIDRHPNKIGVTANDPHYAVWSTDEVFDLNRRGEIILSSIEPNPFGRIPGVLIHGGYRTGSILDATGGEDMASGHLAVWLLETLKLKEAKSQVKQTALLGETGQTPRGQTQDSERDLILGEGVGITTLDRGVDLDRFTRVSTNILEQLAGSRGISPQVLHHQGAASGHEIALRRIPLEEVREDQIEIFRTAERELAEVQASVLMSEMPELSFDTTGWHIDFAEVKRPLSEKERYDVRAMKRRMGHSDAFLEALEDNPDFTPDMAVKWVADRMTSHGLFIEQARTRANIPADADLENPGQAPQVNGRGGQTALPPAEEEAEA